MFESNFHTGAFLTVKFTSIFLKRKTHNTLFNDSEICRKQTWKQTWKQIVDFPIKNIKHVFFLLFKRIFPCFHFIVVVSLLFLEDILVILREVENTNFNKKHKKLKTNGLVSTKKLKPVFNITGNKILCLAWHLHEVYTDHNK